MKGTLDSNVEFDLKWNLCGFKGSVLDLTTFEFRENAKDDYIEMSTGYEWREPTQEESKFFTNLYGEILPDNEERKCHQTVLSTALMGKTLERFTIFQGKGRNGKGLLDEVLMTALGEREDGYAYKGPVEVLTGGKKLGACPEIANMNKKRLVCFTEPQDKKERLNNSICKELTGGRTTGARRCYSNDRMVHLLCTIILECNDPPEFQESITDAERERLISVLFPCKYTSNEKILDERKKIYKANPTYKTIEFQEQYKFAMMRILIDTYKEDKGEV